MFLEEAVFRLSRDHIARPDFAFRYAGGTIVDELTTPPLLIDGINVPGNPPSVALDDDIRIGGCWLTQVPSQLGISLAARVRISHITIDHLAKELALSAARTLQAPREVIVWGVVDSNNSRELEALKADLYGLIRPIEGSTPSITGGLATLPISFLSYNISHSDNVQTFPVFEPILRGRVSFSQVIVEVRSNWGHELTCLYRVRVHGELEVQP
ncbi:hypothetical protein BDN72DRAFT_773344 [Pluteus cervinus]|uniref:Uncharacterized protein n=1 Tax=Pluteus cervinus TaxID=181527 RepID=A0ACD3AHV0_9AGAR|nr:hypothetical protein BDN72DRAFT_773344 [Pluteus cervinus]